MIASLLVLIAFVALASAFSPARFQKTATSSTVVYEVRLEAAHTCIISSVMYRCYGDSARIYVK
jgi:hypothetical protein